MIFGTASIILLELEAHHLARHHATIAVHEGHTGRILAVLEYATHQELAILEGRNDCLPKQPVRLPRQPAVFKGRSSPSRLEPLWTLSQMA